jgi:uncharacterized protein YebE (UPF0316 family)
MRGRKGIAWVLGFFQSAIFVVAITSVLSNLDNPLNIIGYAAGFATGNVVGMTIEERLAVGHTDIRIISSRRGAAIAERLRAGYAVTGSARQDGIVASMSASGARISIECGVVNDVDLKPSSPPDIRPVRHGFWRMYKSYN